jgi:hypothetical protein
MSSVLDVATRVGWLVARGTDRGRAELIVRRGDVLLELRRLWSLVQYDTAFVAFAARPDVADLSKEAAKLGGALGVQAEA